MPKPAIKLVTFLGAVIFALLMLGEVSAQSISSPSPRVVVVISDLHFGMGECMIGKYCPQEDFQWGADFITFLEDLNRAGTGRVTLVIAGDMFELWEASSPLGAPPGDRTAPPECLLEADPSFGCSESEAYARMWRIVSAHRLELQALGDFASRGSNRVIIVPGNHDVALFFPTVWDLILSASRPSRSETFEMAKLGRWISTSGDIVVEHGHQVDDANRFEGWPHPVAMAPDGVERLRSPFGERLVRKFFDRLEQDYPVVDNITGEAGIFYGVKSKGFLGTAGVFTDFLKLVLLETSWHQFTEFLGQGGNPPVWNVDAIRASPVEFLVDSFSGNDSAASITRDLLSQPSREVADAAAATVVGMKDDEILAICQSRYVDYLSAGGGVPNNQRAKPCERKSGDLGYLKQAAVQQVRGSSYYLNKYLLGVVDKLDVVKDYPGPVTFVYGHTHAATRAMRPNSRFTVINTGAWQRLISADSVAVKAKKLSWAPEQVLSQLSLSDLPACYSLVWIPLDEKGKAAEAKLRYWALDGNGWKFKTACPAREALPPE